MSLNSSLITLRGALINLRNAWFTSQPLRYFIFGCIALISLALIMKGCGMTMSSENTYIIAQDSRWKSLNYMGKERNLTAFNTELLADIARKEGFRVRVSITPAPDLLKELEKGTVQGIIATIQPSSIYENRFIFSNPILLTGPVLIIRSAAPIKGWNEMGRKIIGVQPHSAALLGLEKDPTIQVHLYDDILAALSDLNERKIDGVIYPAFAAHVYTSTFYPKDLKIVTRPLNDEGLRLIALKNKEGEQLINQFNKGLEELKQSGSFKKLIEQWGLTDVESSQ